MSYEQSSTAVTETRRMIQLLDIIKFFSYSNQPNIEKNQLIHNKDQLHRQHSKVIESINETTKSLLQKIVHSVNLITLIHPWLNLRMHLTL